MEAPELKPCPFCGGEAEMWNAHDNRPAWIACMGRCAVLVSREHSTDAAAASAWNTRAPDPDLDAHIGAALVEAAETAKEIADQYVGYMSRIERAIRALRPTAMQALERVRREARVEALKQAADAVDRIGPRVTGDAIRALIAAEARVKVLEDALREIEADCEAEYPPSHGAIKYRARAALEGDKTDGTP